MVQVESGRMAPGASDRPGEPGGRDAGDVWSMPARSVRDESGGDLHRDPPGLHASTGRMLFVLILTIAVMVFAVLIAVWMYWLGGQLPAVPAGSIPTT
jgi:hypothetical protein